MTRFARLPSPGSPGANMRWRVVFVALALLIGWLDTARANEPSAVPPTAGSLASGPAAPPTKSPALDVQPASPPDEKPSVFRRWWFWTTVGAAAATTNAVIEISARGSDPPATDLGNQGFRR